MSTVEKDFHIFKDKTAALQHAFNQQPVLLDQARQAERHLAHMVEIDQAARRFILDSERNPADIELLWAKFGPWFQDMDLAHTATVMHMLSTRDWFNISSFGVEADRNAWLLVQHADLTPVFQEQILKTLDKLYRHGETRPANYAYLFDRVACKNSRPQRYGTQIVYANGAYTTGPLEAPEKIDERRASVGLQTLAEYMKQFSPKR